MCRELNREPAWVGAIRLALTEGALTPDGVIEEANLRSDRHRTVENVLATMAEQDLIEETPGPENRYLVGPVLRRAAPDPSQIGHLSDRAVHQWD